MRSAGWERAKPQGKTFRFQLPRELITYHCTYCRPQAQRSQTNRGPSGLRPNWQNARAIQSPTVFRAPRENQAGINSDSDANQPNRSTQVPSRGVTTEPDDIPVYNYGGFVSENSGLERYDHEGEQNSSESLKYKVRPTFNRTLAQSLTRFL